MHIGKWTLYGVFCFVLTTCNKKPSNMLLDVNQIANLSQNEVESLIGKPDTTYFTPILNQKIFTQLYFRSSYAVEILYPKGKATEIIVNKPNEWPFSRAALAPFNVFPESAPTDSMANVVVTWNNVGAFQKITLYSQHLDSIGNPDQWKIFFRTK